MRPFPLAWREAGVYHNVSHTGDKYVLTGERQSFWQKLRPGQTIHLAAGQAVYVYTAIFAPTDLSTRIYHRWQYYDENKKIWLDKDRLSFAINGGRLLGYRGYSLKHNLTLGRWRVLAETERGQVMGRINFKAAAANEDVRPETIYR